MVLMKLSFLMAYPVPFKEKGNNFAVPKYAILFLSDIGAMQFIRSLFFREMRIERTEEKITSFPLLFSCHRLF